MLNVLERIYRVTRLKVVKSTIHYWPDPIYGVTRVIDKAKKEAKVSWLYSSKFYYLVCFWTSKELYPMHVSQIWSIISKILFKICNTVDFVWTHYSKMSLVMRNIQGVSFEILQFQMAVAQKLCIFDLMLVKPKCVWEAVVFFNVSWIFHQIEIYRWKMTKTFTKLRGLMDRTLDW